MSTTATPRANTVTDVFEVVGGHKLKGTIVPQGAKNEALQILCATLLTDQTVTINNVPDILDVNMLIQLLKDFGVKVKKISDSSYTFKADDVNLDYLYTEKYRQKAA